MNPLLLLIKSFGGLQASILLSITALSWGLPILCILLIVWVLWYLNIPLKKDKCSLFWGSTKKISNIKKQWNIKLFVLPINGIFFTFSIFFNIFCNFFIFGQICPYTTAISCYRNMFQPLIFIRATIFFILTPLPWQTNS